MMRSRAVLVVCLLVAGVSACGGGPTLHDRLLSVSDLPAGWTAAPANVSTPKVTNTPCLSRLPTRPQGWTYESAAFVDGTSIPNFGEVLARGEQVAHAWRRLDDALGRCRTATFRFAGETLKAAVRHIAFPRIGRSSSAYAWSFTFSGIRFSSDLVLFRTGDGAGYLSYADLGAPRISTVAAFARAAAKKGESGSTARIPDGISITSAPVQVEGKVAYRAIGRGRPLLLITGYSGTMESWDRRFVDALAQHHRVITFDNAGVGRTQALPVPLTIAAMAEQTSALVDALHLRRVDVLGWSMGSMVAQALAVMHPQQVRRLVLCASFPGNGTTVRPSRQELNAFESGKPQKVLAALFPADQSAAQNAYLAAVSSYPSAAAAPAPVVAAQGRAVDAWWAGSDQAGRKTAAIAAPALVADGTADRLDPVANSRALAKLLPHAQLRLYPGAGHAFLFQEPSFVPLVERFLRGSGPG